MGEIDSRAGPSVSPTQVQEEGSFTPAHGRNIIQIINARAICLRDKFDLEEHRCVPSSFEDYEANKCWICMSGADQWDMWLACRHLFCATCSTEMLARRMPCPL